MEEVPLCIARHWPLLCAKIKTKGGVFFCFLADFWIFFRHGSLNFISKTNLYNWNWTEFRIFLDFLDASLFSKPKWIEGLSLLFGR